MTVWARLASLGGRSGRLGASADAPGHVVPVQARGSLASDAGRSVEAAEEPFLLAPPHRARAAPVPVVPASQWRARRDPLLVYERLSHAERAGLIRQRPNCELCRRRSSAAVDHDARSGRVRGVVCRSCNSWLGSMEAALRVPRARMQTQAAYLHWRFEAGGTAALAWYQGELSYLGTDGERYAQGLRRVRQLLSVPYVYWTGDGSPVTRDTQWTKIGPLADALEADRHLLRLRRVLGCQSTVLIAFEPDDRVNSPIPRGLIKPFAGEPAIWHAEHSRRPEAHLRTASAEEGGEPGHGSSGPTRSGGGLRTNSSVTGPFGASA